MAQYRRPLSIIDAVQWTGDNFDECKNFGNDIPIYTKNYILKSLY
jgi:hypothetical protein